MFLFSFPELELIVLPEVLAEVLPEVLPEVVELVVLLGLAEFVELEAEEDERSAEYDPGAFFSAVAWAQSAFTIVPV